jgi:hypothetical protein
LATLGWSRTTLISCNPEGVASPLANRKTVATPSELRLNKQAPYP